MHSPVPLLFLALAPAVLGWPVGSLHQARSPIAGLPAAERALITRLVRPDLGPLFQGEPQTTLDKAIRSFPAERVGLGATRAVVVQASGSELCDSGANCALWIIDLQHRRVLLKTVAHSYALTRSASSAVPDLVTRTQRSVTEGELTRWRHDDPRYVTVSCATVDNADSSGTSYAGPRFTPHPCNEGNDSSR